jgi:hypothetical protein
MLLRDWGTSAVGRADAAALPASEKVSPAAPNAGTAAALVRRFVLVRRLRFDACFTRDMSHPPCQRSDSNPENLMFGSFVTQVRTTMNGFTNSLSDIRFLFMLMKSRHQRLQSNRARP